METSELLRYLDSKFEKVDERLNAIELTQAAQHVSLAEHMRRTVLLEEALKPVVIHVAVAGALVKVIAVLGTCVGIAVGAMKLLGL